MDDFDPYYIWLGIPPEEQPADHYRLLGIRRFEQNPDVIANAADGKMAYLRTLQVGKRAKQSQALLNEIAAAHACLLNSKSRIAYDARLRAADAARAVPPLQAASPSAPLVPLPAIALPPLPLNGQPSLTPVSGPPPVLIVPSKPVAVAVPSHAVDWRTSVKALPPGAPAGVWQQLQNRLESLPGPVVIALGVGPVVVALAVLIAVIVATSGSPHQQGNTAATKSPAQPMATSFSSPPPQTVPPRPLPNSSAPSVRVGPPRTESNRPDQATSPAMPGPPPQLRVDTAGGQVHRAVLSERGDYLAVDATHENQRRVQVFHVPLGRKLMSIDAPALLGRMDMIGDLIVIASEPQGLVSFEAASGRLRTLQRVDGKIQDVALSPDARWAFVLTDSELLWFDTENFESRGNLLIKAEGHSFKQLFTQPNLVMAVGDSGLEVIELETRRHAAVLQLSPPRAWRGFLPDDQSYFRLFESGGTVRYERHGLHNRGRFAEANLPRGAPPVSQIVKSEQGGNLIAWHGPGQELSLFHLLHARPVGRIVPGEAPLANIALSADGQRLAAREGNGPLLVFAVSPLLRGHIGFSWPGKVQLQRMGGAVTSASILGPATKNVRVDRVGDGDS